jgi:hypothetical protein
MSMNLNDQMILIAFVSSLSKLQQALPPEVQQQVNDPNRIEKLDVIAEDYPLLDKIYQEEFKRLSENMPNNRPSPPADPPRREHTAELTNMARPIFDSTDSVAEAKKPENRQLWQKLYELITGKKTND